MYSKPVIAHEYGPEDGGRSDDAWVNRLRSFLARTAQFVLLLHIIVSITDHEFLSAANTADHLRVGLCAEYDRQLLGESVQQN